eukprot:Amastigsp_a17521_8.p4 type:complete len:133 gc:universal Amastigsp_a17521_8:415-17(-)
MANALNGVRCAIAKVARRAPLAQLEHINQVVGHTSSECVRRLCCADLEVLVHLHRVCRHDLAAHPRDALDFLGDKDRGLGLARCSCANDREGRKRVRGNVNGSPRSRAVQRPRHAAHKVQNKSSVARTLDQS